MIPPSDNNSDSSDRTAVIQGDQETLKKELQKAKEQEACLIIIRGQPQGHRYFLTQSQMILGRDPSVDIVVSDQSVSRKHAQISKEGDKVKLTELGSSNGSFVNDKKLGTGESVYLEKEDMVKLGNSIFKYLPAGELEILLYGNLGLAAHTDALTKLYNKGYLFEALEAEFKRAKALHSELAVIFFDLDFFKKVNDTHGHDAGDYVLKEIAALIRGGHVRPKDVFARNGGEEFVILLANTGLKAGMDMGERIRAAVEAHAFIYEGKRLPITISVGVAELRSDIEAAQTLLKASDKALYAAKLGGRNRVVAAS
jgi:diguanylate cyclase (GGDEF)-like protein